MSISTLCVAEDGPQPALPSRSRWALPQVDADLRSMSPLDLLQLQSDLIGHVDRAHSQITHRLSRLELGLSASSESASSRARAGRNEGRFNRAAAESVAVASAMVTGASDDGERTAAGDGEGAGAVEEPPRVLGCM